VAAAVIVTTVTAKVAVSFWEAETAGIVQVAVCPAQKLPAAQLTKWKLAFVGVAVIVAAVPASTEQLTALLQLGVVVVTRTLPSAAGVAVAPIVKVTGAKVATSFWEALTAGIVQVAVCPAQKLPAAQLTNTKLAFVGAAVIVTGVPESTVQLTALLQLGVVAVTKTVPSPTGVALAPIVNVTGVKFAVSISPFWAA
jgi:hypothetical protein